MHSAGSQYLRKLQEDPETSYFASQWDLPFTGCTVIVNRLTKEHKDLRGRYPWYDLLIGVGNYTRATLVLPELELTFAYPPGTGIFLSGTLLKHKVDKWTSGDWIAYAFYSKIPLFDYFGIQLPNRWPNHQNFITVEELGRLST